MAWGLTFLGFLEPQAVAAASPLGVPDWWSGGAVATFARGPVYRLGRVAWGLKRLKNMKAILVRKLIDLENGSKIMRVKVFLRQRKTSLDTSGPETPDMTCGANQGT